MGFAGRPGSSPEIVVAVIVEHGLHGDAAAPLAAKIPNFYLDKKYGHPFDPEPTLGERWRSGRFSYGNWDPPNRRLVPPAAVPSSSSSEEEKGKEREKGRRS